MKGLRVLYHLVRADFLERVRRYNFLVTLAAAMYLGYCCVTGKVLIRLDEYRRVYNSAWLGCLMTLVATTFLKLNRLLRREEHDPARPGNACRSNSFNHADHEKFLYRRQDDQQFCGAGVDGPGHGCGGRPDAMAEGGGSACASVGAALAVYAIRSARDGLHGSAGRAFRDAARSARGNRQRRLLFCLDRASCSSGQFAR